VAHDEKTELIEVRPAGSELVEPQSRGSQLITAFDAVFESGLRENIEASSPDIPVFLSLAHFEAAAKNFNEARRYFNRVTEIDHGNVAALTGLASVEQLAGLPLQAQNLLLRAARIRALDGLPKEARGLYRRAAESLPSRPFAWAEWGSFEEWQGDAARALECFAKSGTLAPSSYAQWAGFVARHDGPDKACDLLHRAHADGVIGPQLTTVWAEWGLLESRLGDYASGERRLREALERARKEGDPDALAQSLMRMARAQAEMGQGDAAEATFREALQADSRDPLIKAHAADFLAAARGRIAEAAELYASAVVTAPHSYELKLLNESFQRLRQKAPLLTSWVALRGCQEAPGASSAERVERSRELVTALAAEVECATAPLFLSTQKFYGLRLEVGELLGEVFADLKLPVMVAQGPQLSREDIIEVCSELSQEHKVNRAVIILPLEGPPRLDARAAVKYVRGAYSYDVILLDARRFVGLLQAPDARRAVRELILSQLNLAHLPLFKTEGPVYEANFFGREKELGEIIERIGTSSYVIVGGRRIGKTSILKQLQKVRLPGAGFTAFFHDCSYTNTEAKLVRAVTSKSGGWFAQPSSRPPESFAEVIEALPADKPLVILLDEADKIIESDRAAGYPIFNTIAALSKNEVCRFVLCGERALLAELQNGLSPLYNMGTTMIVGNLEPQAVEELVTQSMRRLHVELTGRSLIVGHIQEFTSGHPNVVQILCQHLVKRLNQRYPPRITPEDVVEVAGDPDFLRKDFLKVYWERATLLERLSSLLMVKDDHARTLSAVRQTFARHGLEAISATDLAHALERLVDLRNILRRTRANGGYEFAATAFRKAVALAGFADDYITRYREVYLRDGDVVPEGDV
jgi:tetratricopeptide (TPR) repeat protein